MRIVPYQVRFEADSDSREGKYTVSKPTAEMREVPLSKDGTYYEIHTHDRGVGSGENPDPFYYQIAFRIEDPSPYQIEELTLSLDSFMYRDPSQLAGSNLYCEPETKYNLQANLWYQPSRYVWQKGEWRVAANTDKKALPVDCITASGVFRIVVLAGGAVVQEEPWVYILPSSISKEDYCEMLNDLVDLHERLIAKESSSVGVDKQTVFEYEKNHLQTNIHILKQCQDLLYQIMQIPSEQLGKRYGKTYINKVKKYDSKVVKDYIRFGCSGKVMGIEYYEDHDTYENRVIKSVLRRVTARFVEKKISPPDSSSIDEQVERIMAEEISESSKNARKRDELAEFADVMKEDIRTSLVQKKSLWKLEKELLQVSNDLAAILSDSWFSAVSDISYVSEIKETPKFIHNPYYAQLYHLILQLMREHPLLSFDSNAFGITSTETVYEYWVFYKMLYQLQTVGFSVEYNESLLEHFNSFLDNLSNGGKVKGYSVRATRMIKGQPFTIEFGNERTFAVGSEWNGEKIYPLTPDYYFRVVHQRKRKGTYNYWYFFDAKYRCFSATDQSKENYLQLIYDVSVAKYISRMSVILNNNVDEFGSQNHVAGSFLIMADVDDSYIALSRNGRLFGGTESIFQKNIKLLPNLTSGEGIDNTKYQLPHHRYGGIQLTPSHDEELGILFQLIFELLETERYGIYGPTLNVCWRCNSDEVERVEKKTARGHSKFAVRCTKCNEFRFETHCRKCGSSIIRHASNNYHQKVLELSNRWVIQCPGCGNTWEQIHFSSNKKPAVDASSDDAV